MPGPLPLTDAECHQRMADSRSCRFIQHRAEFPINPDSRVSVSAVMPRPQVPLSRILAQTHGFFPATNKDCYASASGILPQRFHTLIISSAVIINDFNMIGISFPQGKSNATLLMNAQAVLSASLPWFGP